MARKTKSGFTKAEEDAFLRSYRLAGVYEEACPVVVDGVTIDLTCDLDRKLWRPVSPLGTYGHRAALYGPRILFPWTPPQWRAILSRGGEALEAPPGSRVWIATVQATPLETPLEEFEGAGERECKHALLWLHAPGQDLKLVDRPLLIVAETATAVHIRLDDYGAAYRSMVAKLERLTGLDDLEDHLQRPKEERTPLPEGVSGPYREAVWTLHEALDQRTEEAYAAFGYTMARAEATTELLPAARRGRESAANQAKGGAARRRQSRERTEVLRDLARAIFMETPDISKTACARRIRARLDEDEKPLFSSGESWIAKQIEELFEPRPRGGGFRPKRTLAGS